MLSSKRFSKLAGLKIREHGLKYFHSGRVSVLEESSHSVSAIVYGSYKYFVTLESAAEHEDEIETECECEYFSSDGICKHIFAVMFWLEQHGQKFRVPGNGAIYAADGNDWNAEESLELYFDPDQRHPKKGPSLAPWQQFLDHMGEENSEENYKKPSAPKIYEWWYGLASNSGYYFNEPYAKFVILQRELNKNGKWGSFKQLDLSRFDFNHSNAGERFSDVFAPTPLDAEILHMLQSMQIRQEYSYHAEADGFLMSDLPIEFWRKISDSQHLILLSAGNQKVEIEKTKPLSLDDSQWEHVLSIKNRGGSFHVQHALKAVNGEKIIFQAERILPNIFIDDHQILCLRENSPEHDNYADRYFNTPEFEIPKSNFDDFMSGLNRSQIPIPLLLPKSSSWKVETVEPKVRLIIDDLPSDDNKAPIAKGIKLQFFYNEIHVPLSSKIRIMTDSERKTYWNRNFEFENQVCQELFSLKFIRAQPGYSVDFIKSSQGLIDAIFLLVEKDWDIYVAARRIKAASEFNIKFKSGIDWFEVDENTEIFEGVTFPALLEAAKQNAGLIRCSDSTSVLLPEALRQKLTLLLKLGDEKKGRLRFQKNQALLLDTLLSELSTKDGSPLEKNPALLLEQAQFKKLQPSKRFTGTLRPYQLEALSWLQYLKDMNLNGCLADDMGLGKTVQVLAWLQLMAENSPDRRKSTSLLVVPRSLVHNWINEIKRFAPDLTVFDASQSGMTKKHFEKICADHDLLIITYSTLRLRVEMFLGYRFEYVILDEAQNIKNPQSISAKAVRLIRCQHRLAMTGTPVENHLGDLWSIFEFLNPGILGKASGFSDWQGQGNAMVLFKALGPLILRRTKEQVLVELPSKSEQLLLCPLEGKQKKIYNEIRDYYRASIEKKVEIDGLNKSKMHVLEALLRLRQVACHPALVDAKQNSMNSSKLEVLIEHLLELKSIGRKSLVFSQFTSLLDLVKKRLDEHEIAYEYLDGKTKDRAGAVDRFQNDPKKKVFLLSLKAGGVGLNLTAAEYCFILDPWWNPAVEAQAVDRAHRIGQDKHVFVYRLVCEQTVEEKILALQEQKRDLAKMVITEDKNLLRSLTKDDLLVLLS